MDTPIFDFVQNYIKSNTARLHMPGHKGVSFLGCEAFDITEIRGADELYAPDGIIRKSEENATLLFGTAKTVYSAGGSSQSINAMLYLSYIKADKSTRPFVLAGRNAHKSFIYALAKLDTDVEWISPENTDSICSCIVNGEMVEKALKTFDTKPFAVYITSPDYLGGMSDIPSIAKVCKSYDIPLLVDNAHGSYLKFYKQDLHPISLGADMCCDSAHKTLPVLTGGGYLHIAKNDKYNFSQNVVNAMAIFGSTSPSYLILQALDLCNKYIDERIKNDIEICAEKVAELGCLINSKGFGILSGIPSQTLLSISAPLKMAPLATPDKSLANSVFIYSARFAPTAFSLSSVIASTTFPIIGIASPTAPRIFPPVPKPYCATISINCFAFSVLSGKSSTAFLAEVSSNSTAPPTTSLNVSSVNSWPVKA